jgi:hypothetical protein
MPMEGNAPRAKAAAQEGLVVGPTFEKKHPDAFLRDVIIALDKFPACASQHGHFLGSRGLILVDIELALGVISLVRRS